MKLAVTPLVGIIVGAGVLGGCGVDDGLTATAPVSTPSFYYYSCDLPDDECTRLKQKLDALAAHFANSSCEDLVNDALARYNHPSTDIGFRWGGTADGPDDPYGFILPGEYGNITRITSKGLEDLGPTAIHEEAHHQDWLVDGVTDLTESQAEFIGMSCGSYAE
ncbi:MAG: hypothetical protein WEA24_06160 [Gemmatimonadota bacterium]